MKSTKYEAGMQINHQLDATIHLLKSKESNGTMKTKHHRGIFKFKVCESVHHHTIQINHQLDATIPLLKAKESNGTMKTKHH